MSGPGRPATVDWTHAQGVREGAVSDPEPTSMCGIATAAVQRTADARCSPSRSYCNASDPSGYPRDQNAPPTWLPTSRDDDQSLTPVIAPGAAALNRIVERHVETNPASTVSLVPAMPRAGMMSRSPACDAPRKTETLLQPQTLPNFDRRSPCSCMSGSPVEPTEAARALHFEGRGA